MNILLRNSVLNILLVFFFTIFLSACETTDDPRGGGLLGGMKGIYGGDYDRRVNVLKERAEKAKEQNSLLSEENQLLELDKQNKENKLYLVNNDIKKIENNLIILENQINTGNRENSDYEKELDNIKLTLDEINQKIKLLRTKNYSDDEIAELNRRKEDLEEYYHSLLELLNNQI